MEKRIAIYVRVSKSQQDFQRQLSELRKFASENGYNIVEEISEKQSGSIENREGIAKIINLAKSRKISMVLIHEVSRLGRNTIDSLKTLETLTENKVCLYILNSGIQTINSDGSKNEMAQTMFTIMAEFARVERTYLIDRINSGLDEALRKGKVLGRKKGTTESVKIFLKKYKGLDKHIEKNISLRDIKKVFGHSVNTIQKYKKLKMNQLHD
jgi:DNA invertase Pin-like site-specific DNA recombinase